MSTEPLRITRFSAENFMRLVVVDISPSGDVIEITGRNRQGKTSVLDGIWAALGGTSVVPDMPIRRPKKGSEEPAPTKASITVELGTDGTTRLTVTRTFTAKGGSLKITNADGFEAAKPQQMLDKLMGSLSMDPMAFLAAKPKDQAELLRQLVGLDTSAIDAERKRLYEQRTLVNRDVAMRTGEVDGIRLLETPEPVDVSALLVEQREAERLAGDHEAWEREIAKYDQECRNWDDEIAEAATALRKAEDRLTYAQGNLAGMKKLLAEAQSVPAPVVPDREEIRERIESAGEINLRVAAAENAALRKRQAEDRLRGSTQESDSLTAKIKTLDANRAKLIAACQFPLPGLAIEEGVVLYDGVPLSQASDAEQRQISMAIAMAQDPQLRVIRIRDGSLLDSEAREDVARFAAEHDLQVWMETVQSGNPAAIVIEDGSVMASEVDEMARMAERMFSEGPA
jgi:DNA repair exonuclease SbcCD ATPase subunit